MTIPSVDSTTLNNLSPNLDIGDVADPALRLASFQYIYTQMQTIVSELNNIPAGNLQSLSVTTGKIAELAVTTGKIAELAVTTGKLNDLAVTLEKMAANSVGTTQLIDQCVTTAKIALASVGVEQLSPGAQVNESVNNALIVALKADVVQRAINVKSAPYNAKGDWNGTTGTDDTAAIQAALASLVEGGTLFFPKGNYLYTSPIIIDKPIKIVGAGRTLDDVTGEYLCSLVKDGNFTGVSLMNSWSGIEDIVLDSINVSDTLDGLYVEAGRIDVKNIISLNHGRHGIWIKKSNSSFYSNIACISNGQDGIFIQGTTTPDANAMFLSNLDLRTNGRHGLNIDTAFANTFVNVSAQGNIQYGVNINHDYNILLGVYNEANVVGGINLTSNANNNTIFSTIKQSYTDNNGNNTHFEEDGGVFRGGDVYLGGKINLRKTGTSGSFDIAMEAVTRNIKITKTGTSATADIDMSSMGVGKGLIVASPNGTRYRISVTDAGATQVTAV